MRLQDKEASKPGSPTHLLWLATMGMKETYLITVNRTLGDDKVYNNGMRFLAYGLLTEIVKKNNETH